MPRKNCMSEKREQILKAFGECMKDHDIETVGVREIAACSGVPSGSIHYYFKSKCEIMLAYFQRILEDERKLLSGWADNISPQIDTLGGFCSAFLDLVDSQRSKNEGNVFCYSHFYAMVIKHPEVREIMNQFYADMTAEIARALRNTRCECSDPEKLALMLIIQRDGLAFVGEMCKEEAKTHEEMYAFMRELLKK